MAHLLVFYIALHMHGCILARIAHPCDLLLGMLSSLGGICVHDLLHLLLGALKKQRTVCVAFYTCLWGL